MERLLTSLVNLIQLLINKLSTEDRLDIDVSSQDYENDKGFFLYVGTEGTVKGVTFNGATFTTYHIAGYHPVRLRKIFSSGTTATNLAVHRNI